MEANDYLFKMNFDYALDNVPPVVGLPGLGQLTETWVDAFEQMAMNTGATSQVMDDRWISKFDPGFEQTKQLVNWRTQDAP